jgi:hypothetical protein
MPPKDPYSPQVNPDISGPQPMPMDIHPVPAPPVQGLPTPPMGIKRPKRHVPVLPIVLAVLVSMTLIGVTVFVFIMTKGDKQAVEEVQETKTTEVETGRVSADDIDTTNKEIDKNLNSVNDSTDFRTEDLSNQSLGL